MKRLLSYLFLVVGIGLVFNNFAFAECIKGNCINGQGTLTYADGRKYFGEFKDGKKHGQGTATAVDGRIKKGIWKDGQLVKEQ